MKYYGNNWEALQEHFPKIAQRILEDADKDGELEIKNIPTREEADALVITGAEGPVRLNSTYRPLQEAVKWADQYAFQNIDVNVIMFGFGNGIFVRELLKRLKKDSRLFLVESQEEIFSFVLENEDISDILSDTRLILFVGKEYGVPFKKAVDRAVCWNNLFTQIRCEHPGYKQLWPEEYNNFWDIVDQTNDVVITKAHTNVYFSHEAVKNALASLAYVRESNYITELVGKLPEELPAVIVAAGPSLDKNVEELRRMKGHAFIIATDTAVRILEERGLPYDCIITLDPAKPAEYLKDYPGCAQIPLFFVAESQREILHFHKGRKIWLPGSVYISEIYSKNGYTFPYYSSGGSVATAGFWVAKMIGLKNIVLIGQDLAFMGDSTHAGGHENHILNEKDGIKMIEGVNGELVRSRRDWIYYLHRFEETIKEYPELNVIDATEGGALIHGSHVMSLAEVVDKYCNIDFSFADLMDELPPTFEVNDFEPFEKEFNSLEKGFSNIISKSKEGIKFADEFIEKAHSISAKRHDRLLRDIRKVNNFIARQAGYQLVDLSSSALMLGDWKNINCITGDSEEDEINTVKQARALYQSLIEAAEQLQKLYKEVKI